MAKNLTFVDNPQLGVNKSHTAALTATGKEIGMKLIYYDYEEAVKDCERANTSNPCGGYAVCKVI